jgi:hypothetical protein
MVVLPCLDIAKTYVSQTCIMLELKMYSLEKEFRV